VARPSSVTTAQWAHIETLVHQGLPISEIAPLVGLPEQTLRYALKTKRPDLDQKARTKGTIPVAIYDRAVVMLRQDPTLSIKLTAKRLGISTGALTGFLKSVNLYNEFATRFRKSKTGLSKAEIKKRATRRARKIRLVPFEVYRDIRNDKLYLAVSPRELLRPGALDGRPNDLHMPSSVHTTAGWTSAGTLSTEDLLFDWGLSPEQLDAIVEPFFLEWRREVEAGREQGKVGKAGEKTPRGAYKGMLPLKLRRA
jgi:hypothetical protein